MSEPPILNYQKPEEVPPAGGVPVFVQGIIGFFAFYAALSVCSFVCAIINSAAGFLLIIPFVFFCAYARTKWRWRGFIPGVLFAFLLPLLLLGLCYVIIVANN